jgi:hypothetical protein
MRVMIGTPSAGIVHAAYAMSLTKMIMHYLQTPIVGHSKDEKREMQMQMVVGANIGQNRDNIVEAALKADCTHVLFIDDDMGFEQDALNVVASRQMPVVIANYRRKILPGTFTARNADNTATIVTTDESQSLEPCSFGGFGFALIERKVFEAIEMPRFLMYYDPKSKIYTTEDKPFFEKVAKAGFQAYVDHDLTKKVYHNGTFQYRWDDTFEV